MAKTLYHCPDCYQLHEDPADAAYALSVTCTSCALERELAAVSRASRPDFVEAA